MSSIARRYAKALFSLARDERTLDATGNELDRLGRLAADPQIGPVLANPILSQTTRRNLARTLGEQLALAPTTRNFVGLLADHQRLDQLAGIADQYRRLVDQELRRVRARLTSARPLESSEETAMKARLEQITGKTVLAESRVDPALLGGVVVEVEGQVFDGSVRTQLERLAANIAGGRSYL
jgi:F-type H+-transporting ATPase subunit delta